MLETATFTALVKATIFTRGKAATKTTAAVAAKVAVARTIVAAATAAVVDLRATTTLRGALLGLQAGDYFSLEGLLAVALNVKDLATVAEFGKRHSQAIAPCTAGAADAVRVVLCLHGQAVVEHVGDGGYVDAACGHVGRHQHLHLALAQCHQAAVAQALAKGAVQGDCVKAGLLQVVGQAVAFDLRAGKKQWPG